MQEPVAATVIHELDRLQLSGNTVCTAALPGLSTSRSCCVHNKKIFKIEMEPEAKPNQQNEEMTMFGMLHMISEAATPMRG